MQEPIDCTPVYPCPRLVTLEGRVSHMETTVTRNQEEFKGRITGLEHSQSEIKLGLARLDTTVKVATSLLGFMITAGIALIVGV